MGHPYFTLFTNVKPFRSNCGPKIRFFLKSGAYKTFLNLQRQSFEEYLRELDVHRLMNKTN